MRIEKSDGRFRIFVGPAASEMEIATFEDAEKADDWLVPKERGKRLAAERYARKAEQAERESRHIARVRQRLRELAEVSDE